MPYSPRIGRKFGRLTVVGLYQLSEKSDGNNTYSCRCDCGVSTKAKWQALRTGHKKSCGCLYEENLARLKAIGAESRAREEEQKRARRERPVKCRHPLWAVYRGMVRRCLDKTHDAYRFYGGVGVTVCDRWREDFFAFVADMGERPVGAQLDRIDNTGGYSPENCRWADKEMQHSNTSYRPCYVAVVRGVRKLVTDWARKLDLDADKIKADIRKGIPPDVAVVSAAMRKELWKSGRKVSRTEYAECYERAKIFLDLST